MFNRSIEESLIRWSRRKDRKPLILRGARQVGKTTVINMFSKKFDQYIYLDIENSKDRKLFENNYSFDQIIDAIFLYKEKSKQIKNTLIFIDEIQYSQRAVKMLRYFYENASELFVIAAGSLLESLIYHKTSFPVGRIEYIVLRPVSFIEFLGALDERKILEMLEEIPIPEYVHDKLIDLFRYYTLIGGMPEVIKIYSESRDITSLKYLYDGLLTSYIEDVEKYARNRTMSKVIRFIIENIFYYAGSRIKFEGFANSKYKNREMSEAFKTLEKALLVQLVYPITDTKIPIISSHARSPKVQLVDTGLVNYFAGLQKVIFGADMLTDVYQGRISEHITGQELLSLKSSYLYKLNFWIRDKKGSSAEIDFVYNYNDLVIPIEVKSGASGKLRSLNEFMDCSTHRYAIRIYSGKLAVEKCITRKGKEYVLLSLPFYLINKVEQYIDWFMKQYKATVR